jgi:UDP-N-acetylmuramoylalanine--D-glutamate ligase
MRQAILGFTGVPHRLEIVAVADGITYCNDSIATSPERAMASLRSFDQPIVLLACGRNKKLPLDDWARLIRDRVRVLVVMGESAAELEQAVRQADGGSLPRIVAAFSMEEAVEAGRDAANPGDLVLLAPGFTSFDMFKDFEERGERFREVVGRLAGASEEANR